MSSPAPGSATPLPIAAPGSARRRFQDAVVARLSAMPLERASAWLERHGLLALARHPDLPAGLGERLRPTVHRNLAANLRWIEVFRRAVDALGDLPVCPLKGIYLLDDVYAGDPESRPLTDLDLLVPAERIGEAIERLGAALGVRETALSRRTRRWTAERQLAGDGMVIDLHHRLAVRHGTATTWRHLEPVPGEVHRRRVWVLDRETTWVHLVTHWLRHGADGPWRWIEDLLRWRESGLELETVVRRARALGALPSLLAGERALARHPGGDGQPETPAGPWVRARVRLAERLLWPAGGDGPDDGGRRRDWVRGAAAMLLASGPLDAIRAVASKLGERLTARRRGEGPASGRT